MSSYPEQYITVSLSHLHYLLQLVRYVKFLSPSSVYVPFNCIILTITDILNISAVTSHNLTRAEVRNARYRLDHLYLKPTDYIRNIHGNKRGISGYLLGQTVKHLREIVQESSLSQNISSLSVLPLSLIILII